MAHQRIFQVHQADPFAPGHLLDHLHLGVKPQADLFAGLVPKTFANMTNDHGPDNAGAGSRPPAVEQ